jgi:hypothetical protein
MKTTTGKLPPSLADPKLKTTRAKVHLEALRNELDAFYKSKPYTFVPEDDVERGRYCIRVEIGPIPDNIWLIAGDLFYCLRASLDQLVFSLAQITIPYPAGTQFPILDQDIAFNKKVRKRFEGQTLGVTADAVQVIESLQPYHRRHTAAIRSHLLWRLNWMSNIDKHRRIPVHGGELLFTPHFPSSALPFVELDNDNAMVRFPARFKGQVRLDPDVSFKVVFGDLSDGIACDFGGIEQIYNFVADDVIPRFARFFA